MSKQTQRMTLGLVLCVAMAAPGAPPVDAASQTTDVDEQRAVVCLLPGRIRKLGGTRTYVERRKPIETTAPDCEIRGGEYTVYDRANYEVALRIWQEAAEQGDAKAMTYVGEILEKKLGSPDYAQAAAWYQRAVDAGDLRGARNLAYLYEHGLGVANDSVRALDLWRRSMGIGDELVLASELRAVRSDAEKQIAELTAQLTAQNTRTQQLQRNIDESRSTLQREREAFDLAAEQMEQLRRDAAAVRAQPSNAVDVERLATLQAQLRERENRIEDQEVKIALLNNTIDGQSAQVDASARSADIHRVRLEKALAAISADRVELGTLKAAVADRDAQISALRTRLEDARQRSMDGATVVAELERALEREKFTAARKDVSNITQTNERIAQLSAELLARQQALEAQNARVDELRNNWAAAQAEATTAQATAAAAQAGQAEVAGRLATTEADLLKVRADMARLEGEVAVVSTQKAELRAQLAALESESARTTRQEGTLDRVMFKLDELQRAVALKDKQLEDLKFALWKQSLDVEQLNTAQRTQIAGLTRSFAPPPVPVALPPGVKLGRYHALLIANSDYAFASDLSSPENDIRVLQRLLETRYGFDTEVRINLDRMGMYAALKELQRFREDDLVLIYYAGHGAVDERGDGYWLPTDFEPGKSLSAVAIPNEQITKHLNMMSARHVMVVADSCYSGALFRDATPAVARDIHRRLKFFVENPSRTILTSGGDEPVLDSGSDGHSVFAKAFIDVLAANEGLTYGEALYASVWGIVRSESTRLLVPQTPRFAGLADAGHGNGQFVFRPQGRSP